MTLAQHLAEARRRMLRSAAALSVGVVAGWFLAAPVWAWMSAPVRVDADRPAALNYTTITGAFDVRMLMAVIVGVVIASPVWLYQLFAFLVPGMNRIERRYVLGFLLSAIPLFAVGCLAGCWVLPHVVSLLTSFVPDHDASYIDAKTYLDFVVKLTLATGIAFVAPVFLVILNFMGILNARSITRAWRWALLVILLFCAIATPAADVVSMLALAAPMSGLYAAAIGVAAAHDRIVAKRHGALRA